MPLSEAQRDVGRIVLSAGGGRLILAGGGALIAHDLVERETRDLDAFVRDIGAHAFEELVADVLGALDGAGFYVDVFREDAVSFRRLIRDASVC